MVSGMTLSYSPFLDEAAHELNQGQNELEFSFFLDLNQNLIEVFLAQ